MAKVIGIDLGTTNSCVAVMEGGEPVMIPNSLGNLFTPSVVRFLKNGDIVVGDHAARARITDPENTIAGIKRFIGRRYNEVIDIAHTVPFNVTLGKNNLALVNVNGIEYSPQEISAMILQSLKTSAEAYLGEEVSKAVITIPAYFGDIQREATKQAGKIAGLEVLRIINEPTSAALAYGLDHNYEGTILIFDLGGGTLDVTILETGDGVFEVKAIGGDGFLGGDDFDNRIVDWILEEIKHVYGVNVSNDLIAMQRIREVAVNGKCELSQLSEVTIDIPFLTRIDGETINLKLTLTRSKFEELCEELFERLVRPCKFTLEDSGLRPCDIDKVILVGGATRMPKIFDIVKKFFNKYPSRSIHPEEAVVLGAAIQGGILCGEIKDAVLLDAISHSIGIETEGGIMTRILDRDTTIPTSKSQIFSTSIDNQTSVEIHILEGEHRLVVDNRTLGRFILDGIPPAPKGVPQIELAYDVDANGTLYVIAKDKGTGKSSNLRVKVLTGFSESEIEYLSSK
jgi:molecular chaperone DnaK